MPDFSPNSSFKSQNQKAEPSDENLVSDSPECEVSPEADNDLLMERILENINSTPIGQVLKKIALLPEVRRRKVLEVRRQLTDGEYDLNERLDSALEKILEDIASQ